MEAKNGLLAFIFWGIGFQEERRRSGKLFA
jgi:hypothetical protein